MNVLAGLHKLNYHNVVQSKIACAEQSCFDNAQAFPNAFDAQPWLVKSNLGNLAFLAIVRIVRVGKTCKFSSRFAAILYKYN